MPVAYRLFDDAPPDAQPLPRVMTRRKSGEPLAATDLPAAQRRIAELEIEVDRLSAADRRLHELELEYVERQAATNDVLKLIGAPTDLDSVLQILVETAARLNHANHGAIYTLDPESELFTIAASVGYEGLVEYERARPQRAGQDSVVGRAALTGEAVLIPDVLADPAYQLHDVQREFGFRTLLAAPMRRDERIIGVVAAAANEPNAFDRSEVLLLTAFADQAAIAIENVRLLQTIERQRTELSRFVSPQVAALVSSPEGEQLLAGHRRQATAVFCDLRGFTAFSEIAEPEELFDLLRAYHAAMGALIIHHGGTLEHFAGDGMMIFFNDPVPQEDHAERAVRMAVAMRDRFGDLRSRWAKQGYELGLGVGIALGYATLGRIGFEGRYDYGMIGTAVILASRLSSEAKPGQILLSQRAHAAVEDLVVVEPVGMLSLKGFSRPVPAVNVLGLQQQNVVGGLA